MLSAISLTLIVGVNAAPIVPIEKNSISKCPAVVDGKTLPPRPFKGQPITLEVRKNVLVNAQVLKPDPVNVGKICSIPLAKARAKR